MDPLPLSPEQWRDIVQQAVTDSGHGDEVVVGVETTVNGWRVGVLPPITVPATPSVPSQ